MTIVENGGFECTEPEEGDLGAYWLKKGRGDLPEIPSDKVENLDVYQGQYALHVSRDDTVWQYLPGVQEYADSLIIWGAIKLMEDSATARLHLMSGDSMCVVYCFASNPDLPQNDPLNAYLAVPVETGSWVEFTLTAGADFFNAFGMNPRPRFTVTIEGVTGDALFDSFEITTDFYTLSPEELKETILDEMAWTFDLWIEHGLDHEGPENTSCVSHLHDAITGEEVQTLLLCPVWASYPMMADYLKFRENAVYRQLVIDQADLFLRTRHRSSGFMQYWNPTTDTPGGDVALLPVSYFWQVYDLTGDEKYRDAVIAMTDSILAFDELAWITEPIQEGYLQSGFNVDGSIHELHQNQYQIMIRWFDSANLLAETYLREPKQKYLNAMENCAELYITPGIVDYADIDPQTITFEPTWYTWQNLIPAFDDYFGYGIRGLWEIWEAGGFTHAGIEAYLEKAFDDMSAEWRKAMFRGGREAGDEGRGWGPYFWMWQQDPENHTDYQELLVRNGYTIMKGEFGEYGSWMGTGYEDWSPIIGLPGEGATTGASGNALSGLYLAWEASGRNEDFYAAMVTLFRTSQLTYKFDYGYIRTPTPDPEGPNLAGGEFRYLGVWPMILEAMEFSGVDSPEKSAGPPAGFILNQNYPNPFNPATTIRYTLAKNSRVKIVVYDVLGKEVETLVNARLNAGEHTVQWNIKNMASGIYIYKLITKDFVQAKKMLLLK